MQTTRGSSLTRPMVLTLVFACLVLACLLGSAEARGAANPDYKDLVKASLIADVDAVVPGQPFHVGLLMKIKPHWHTYWINPGESGGPTTIKLTGPKGLTFGEIRWPAPTKIVMDGAITYGFEDEVLLSVPVTVAKDLPAGQPITIDAEAEWLVCKDTCIEGAAKLSLRLPVAETGKPANTPLFEKWNQLLTVGRDHPAAVAAIEKIEQPKASGVPVNELNVAWKQAPASVEWFPVSTPAVAIENVTLKNEGGVTKVQFKPNVFDAGQVPGGKVDGVLVWVDSTGRRIAVSAPIQIKL